MKTNGSFLCPVCGGSVPQSAHACPQCGADERTGWSDQTYLDGIDLGDDVDYDDLVEQEFPSHRATKTSVKPWVIAVAAILLLLSIAGLLKIIL